MAKFKNNKESILGLNFKGENGNRTVNPGEVFEAEKDDVPKHYFEQGWISETKEDVGQIKPDDKGAAVNPQADQKLGRNEGPNPVQGSGTSDQKSETDKAAAQSGAYPNTSAYDDTHDKKKK